MTVPYIVFLACGIGCATFGLFTDLAEGSKFFSGALNLCKPAGNLSGKTLVGIVVWLIAWAFLHARWRKRDVASPGKIMAVSLILIVLALIATFPPFFRLLSPA